MMLDDGVMLGSDDAGAIYDSHSRGAWNII